MGYQSRYKQSSNDDSFTYIVLPVCFFMLLILAVFIVRSNYEDACREHGGHPKNVDRAQICLSADGRLIEW